MFTIAHDCSRLLTIAHGCQGQPAEGPRLMPRCEFKQFKQFKPHVNKRQLFSHTARGDAGGFGGSGGVAGARGSNGTGKEDSRKHAADAAVSMCPYVSKTRDSLEISSTRVMERDRVYQHFGLVSFS